MRRGFTLVELLVVIVIIAVLASLVLPAYGAALRVARQGVTQHRIEMLAQAAKTYEFDHAAYPPGTGSGSAALVLALSTAGPKKLPYFEFRPDMLDGSGNILGVVHPGDVIHYRNNTTTSDPAAHNKSSFDLWAPDAKGVPDGCRNW